jgi:hypothetical protein
MSGRLRVLYCASPSSSLLARRIFHSCPLSDLFLDVKFPGIVIIISFIFSVIIELLTLPTINQREIHLKVLSYLAYQVLQNELPVIA